MELALDGDRRSRLFRDLVGNSQDGSFSSSDSLLGTPNGDRSGVAALFRTFVNVDLGIRGVLDLVDRSASSTQNASNRARRDRELQNVVRLLLELSGLVKTLATMLKYLD